MPEIPPVSAGKLFSPSPSDGPGGLTAIGFSVPRTTAQREYLLEHWKPHIVHLEIDVAQLLGEHESNQDHWDLINNAARTADQILDQGMDAVISTSRMLITTDDGKESLLLRSSVTVVLVNIVKPITTRPKYVTAKVRRRQWCFWYGVVEIPVTGRYYKQ